MMFVVLPVRRCPVRNCASAFVGIEEHCEKCRDKIRVQREIAAGVRASRRDMTEHKRLSLRKRLGLLADGSNA
jgi:hypothetical protein